MLQDSKHFSRLFEDTLVATTLNEQVRSIYLQYLWLPEAIMPLSQLIPHIRRVVREVPFRTPPVHPLHLALDNILLTSKWCTFKHNNRPLNVAEDSNDHTGELQFMIWATEKTTLDDSEDIPDERKTHLELEKREVQIQILLYLLKLSLPDPCSLPTPPPLPISRAAKRPRPKTTSTDEDSSPRAVLEDRLESLADRLMLWQMSLPDPEDMKDANSVSTPFRDWAQVFCEDIVQPQFSRILPELYHWLRAKFFRLPAWTDEEDDVSDVMFPRSLSRTASNTPRPDTHPFFLQASKSSAAKRDPAPAPSRSRSRSLSVSLAQEAQEAEARRVNGPKPKRGLGREWSMNRSFKGRDKVAPPRETAGGARHSQTPVVAEPQGPVGVVLVEGTPMKPKKRRLNEAKDDQFADIGGSTVYVAGTPVKSSKGNKSRSSGDYGSSLGSWTDEERV
ncbi:hypothetical protein K488DRAFT_81503 [Vararia minispora EC-137]|uniref:Uncharacterized protein n=1 Tax=Vararia minispora EC-137 TaxID=1314806 RepID=A0ACB8QYN5_9AGAM|nr:hypothetical protein K488DRAFT_81503 [Vararia minispora EC-137]